jgi:plastocyanin
MRTRSLIFVAAASLLIAGCGSSSKSAETTSPPNTSTAPNSPTPGPQVIHVKADEGGALKFDPDVADTLAGKVQLSMANPSPLEHNIAIKGNGVDVKGRVVGQGGTSNINVQLKPGNYEFYCSVPGHEAGGMKGTLHVGTG